MAYILASPLRSTTIELTKNSEQLAVGNIISIRNNAAKEGFENTGVIQSDCVLALIGLSMVVVKIGANNLYYVKFKYRGKSIKTPPLECFIGKGTVLDVRDYKILGCTDSTATNYNPEADTSVGWTGTCYNSTSGCSDPTASNYNPAADSTKDILDQRAASGNYYYSTSLPYLGAESGEDSGLCMPYPSFTPTPEDSEVQVTAEINVGDVNGAYQFLGTVNIPGSVSESWSWNMGNGSTVTNTPQPFNTYAAGTYTVILTVTALLPGGHGNPPSSESYTGSYTFTVVAPVSGCTDETAYGYDPLATIHVAADCQRYEDACLTSAAGDHQCAPFSPASNIPDPIEPWHVDNSGMCAYSVCTDPSADNYTDISDENCTDLVADDTLCTYTLGIPGCTDATMFNYNAAATTDNGSCYAINNGCLDPNAFNFNDYTETGTANLINPDQAVNINTHVAASCTYEGCTDPDATNTTGGEVTTPTTFSDYTYSPQEGLPTVGDEYGGGTLYYAGTNADGLTEGFIVAPVDYYEAIAFSTNVFEAPFIGNINYGDDICDVLQTQEGENLLAVNAALSGTWGGYEDWYVPTSADWGELHNFNTLNANTLELNRSKYWSCTTHNIGGEVQIRYYDGGGASSVSVSNNSNWLRAIRRVILTGSSSINTDNWVTVTTGATSGDIDLSSIVSNDDCVYPLTIHEDTCDIEQNEDPGALIVVEQNTINTSGDTPQIVITSGSTLSSDYRGCCLGPLDGGARPDLSESESFNETIGGVSVSTYNKITRERVNVQVIDFDHPILYLGRYGSEAAVVSYNLGETVHSSTAVSTSAGIAPSSVEGLRTSLSGDGWTGRIIKDYDWYFRVVVPQEDADLGLTMQPQYLTNALGGTHPMVELFGNSDIVSGVYAYYTSGVAIDPTNESSWTSITELVNGDVTNFPVGYHPLADVDGNITSSPATLDTGGSAIDCSNDEETSEPAYIVYKVVLNSDWGDGAHCGVEAINFLDVFQGKVEGCTDKYAADGTTPHANYNEDATYSTYSELGLSMDTVTDAASFAEYTAAGGCYHLACTNPGYVEYVNSPTAIDTSAYEAFLLPSVGDTYGGGTIISITDDATNPELTIALELSDNLGDLIGNLTYSEAVIAITQFEGGGYTDWVLSTNNSDLTTNLHLYATTFGESTDGNYWAQSAQATTGNSYIIVNAVGTSIGTQPIDIGGTAMVLAIRKHTLYYSETPTDLCLTVKAAGCMNPLALNYDLNANTDDGSCTLEVDIETVNCNAGDTPAKTDEGLFWVPEGNVTDAGIFTMSQGDWGCLNVEYIPHSSTSVTYGGIGGTPLGAFSYNKLNGHYVEQCQVISASSTILNCNNKDYSRYSYTIVEDSISLGSSSIPETTLIHPSSVESVKVELNNSGYSGQIVLSPADAGQSFFFRIHKELKFKDKVEGVPYTAVEALIAIFGASATNIKKVKSASGATYIPGITAEYNLQVGSIANSDTSDATNYPDGFISATAAGCDATAKYPAYHIYQVVMATGVCGTYDFGPYLDYITEPVEGCMISTAINYNPAANIPTTTCLFDFGDDSADVDFDIINVTTNDTNTSIVDESTIDLGCEQEITLSITPTTSVIAATGTVTVTLWYFGTTEDIDSGIVDGITSDTGFEIEGIDPCPDDTFVDDANLYGITELNHSFVYSPFTTNTNTTSVTYLTAPGVYSVSVTVVQVDYQNDENELYTSEYTTENFTVGATSDGLVLSEGCTTDISFNYDATATCIDSCVDVVLGCIDTNSHNYDPSANTDDPDNPCVAISYGCMDSTAANYDPEANTASSEANDGEPCYWCDPTLIEQTLTATVVAEPYPFIPNNGTSNLRVVVNYTNNGPTFYGPGATSSTIIQTASTSDWVYSGALVYRQDFEGDESVRYQCPGCHGNTIGEGSTILPPFGSSLEATYAYYQPKEFDHTGGTSRRYFDSGAVYGSPKLWTKITHIIGLGTVRSRMIDGEVHTGGHHDVHGDPAKYNLGRCDVPQIIIEVEDVELIEGCMDWTATNYDSVANVQNVSMCIPTILGCLDPASNEYEADLAAGANVQAPYGCTYNGCTNPYATNFNPIANVPDGSCIIEGCSDETADNYYPNSNTDDAIIFDSMAGDGCVQQNEGIVGPIWTTLAGEWNTTLEYSGEMDTSEDGYPANFATASCAELTLNNIETGTVSTAIAHAPMTFIPGGAYSVTYTVEGSGYVDAGSIPFADRYLEIQLKHSVPDLTSTAIMPEENLNIISEPVLLALGTSTTSNTTFSHMFTATEESNSLAFYVTANCLHGTIKLTDIVVKAPGICETIGCMVTTAMNYDPSATIPATPGSPTECVFSGCKDTGSFNPQTFLISTDNVAVGVGNMSSPTTTTVDANGEATLILASNVNTAAAYHETGSCIYEGCMEIWADNYDSDYTDQPDGVCFKNGCTSNWADNYDAIATIDDGSCYLNACTDVNADNYNANATIDDGSCVTTGCTHLWANGDRPYNSSANIQGTTETTNCTFTGCLTDIATYGDTTLHADAAAILLLVATNPEEVTIVSDSCLYTGCETAGQLNYCPECTEGSVGCVAIVTGCIDVDALNYDSTVNVPTNTCCAKLDTFTTPEFTVDWDCVAPSFVVNLTPNFGSPTNADGIGNVTLTVYSDSTIIGTAITKTWAEWYALNGTASPMAAYEAVGTLTATHVDITFAYDNNGDTSTCSGTIRIHIPSADEAGNTCTVNLGCTDESAFNPTLGANTDDGTCVDIVLGCIESTAFNYNSAANTDNPEVPCIDVVTGCMDSTAFNYNPDANTEGSCTAIVYGCLDSTDSEYDSTANTDTDPTSCCDSVADMRSSFSVIAKDTGAPVVSGHDIPAGEDIHNSTSVLEITRLTSLTDVVTDLINSNTIVRLNFTLKDSAENVISTGAMSLAELKNQTPIQLSTYNKDVDYADDSLYNFSAGHIGNLTTSTAVIGTLIGVSDVSSGILSMLISYKSTAIDCNQDQTFVFQDSWFHSLQYGCTHSAYSQYDPAANVDDGTCSSLFIFGCNDDATAINYYCGGTGETNDRGDLGYCGTTFITAALGFQSSNNSAGFNSLFNGGCATGSMSGDAFTSESFDSCWDNASPCIAAVSGCMDVTAFNYNELANSDDGSCIAVVNGCMEDNYMEYDPTANTVSEPSSCITLIVNGCTDPLYTEYNSAANVDNGTCATLVVEGCTDDDYVEYNALANTYDNTCNTLIAIGCMDDTYCNYDASANTEGSCSDVVGCTDNNFIEYWNNTLLSGIYTLNTPVGVCGSNSVIPLNSLCNTQIIQGCTDSTAIGYIASANVDDGSCEGEILGCMDSTATNYNAEANTDDGTCISVVLGCTDATAFNYNVLANTEDNTCIPTINGCTDDTAFNFIPLLDNAYVDVNTDDGSCEAVVEGCIDSVMFNYDPLANTSDDSCLPVISGCTDTTANNYTESANTDDGSCAFTTGCTDVDAINYNEDASVSDGVCYYCPDPQFNITTSTASTATSNDGGITYQLTEEDLVYFVGNTPTVVVYKFNTEVGEYDPAIHEAHLEQLWEQQIDGVNVWEAVYSYPAAAINLYAGHYAIRWAGLTSNYPCELVSYQEVLVDGIGCMDSTATNFDIDALVDDGSCLVLGCTDINSSTFNENATILDDSCVYPTGCTDSTACNYVGSVTDTDGYPYVDDGSCTYPAQYRDCDGNCIIPPMYDLELGAEAEGNINLAAEAEGLCHQEIDYLCHDQNALNFTPVANRSIITSRAASFSSTSQAMGAPRLTIADDGTCIYDNLCVPEDIAGIMDALNRTITDHSKIILTKMKTGMILKEDYETLWKLNIIDYLLSRSGLDALYNCENYEEFGSISYSGENYLDKFLIFAFKVGDKHFTSDQKTKVLKGYSKNNKTRRR